MRRFLVMLSSGVLVAGLLLGPLAALTSAAPTTDAAAGFACQPRGTLPGSPTTMLSTLNVHPLAGSTLTCLFRGASVPTSIGGPCQYEDAAMRVDFRNRVLLTTFRQARLLCWGGVVKNKTDLAITKTNGTTTEVPGTGSTYTIVASNNGPSAATGVTVSDAFPAALGKAVTWTAIGAGGATGFSPTGIGSIFEKVDLPVGASVTYTVTATIDPAATGSLENTATVASGANTIDTNPANNSATATVGLTPQFDLSVTITDGVTTIAPGSSVTYTVVVSNSGPSSSPTFTSDPSISWQDNAVVSFDFGGLGIATSLAPGASRTYSVTIVTAAGASGNLILQVGLPALDANPANDSATDTNVFGPPPTLVFSTALIGPNWGSVTGSGLMPGAAVYHCDAGTCIETSFVPDVNGNIVDTAGEGGLFPCTGAPAFPIHWRTLTAAGTEILSNSVASAPC